MRNSEFIAKCLAAALLCIGLLARSDARAQLPPIDTGKDQLSSQVRVLVNRIEYSGSTVFSHDQLTRVSARAISNGDSAFSQNYQELVAGRLNRKLFTEDFEKVRMALTSLYIQNGYINSGVILPDQKLDGGGSIKFQIIEGELSRVRVEGNHGVRAGFISERIRLTLDTPLNIDDLKERLELVRQSPLLTAIHADLQPGDDLGEAVLNVKVVEAEAMNYGIRFNNRRSPSVGAERFLALFSHINLTGNGDALQLEWGLTRGGIGNDIEFGGLDDISLAYSFPISAYDTTLSFGLSRSDTLLVEQPFNTLNITSESTNFSLAVRHPFLRTLQSEFAMSASLEVRNSKTELLGVPFSFSLGDRNGESDVTVLRLTQEFTTANEADAWALRSTFSFGLDAFGATTNSGGLPDGKFFTWVGQAHHVSRLGDSNLQLVARASTQLTPDPLLAIERLSIGGRDTVRGYRENQLVRDNGLVLSLELRIPVLFDAATGRNTLYVAPFLDFGYGWNDQSVVRDGKSITSIGAGLHFSPSTNITMQVYWGYGFQDFDDNEDDLQDIGLHFDFLVMRF